MLGLSTVQHVRAIAAAMLATVILAKVVLATVLLATVLLAPAAPATAQEPSAGEPPTPDGLQLAFPLDCVLGDTCWLQNLVDVDPGEAARDHACSGWTYDGHQGTDIRIPNARVMAEGVAVLAPAAGTVLRVRDGMADRTFAADKPDLGGRDCGNGIVIHHGGGWQTQLCHLRQGSVAVRPGDVVAAGTPVAEVGASGNTDFVHLHVTLRRDGAVVDPFTGFAIGEAICGTQGTSLWAPGAFATTVPDAQIVNAGFGAGEIAMADIEDGRVPIDALAADLPALVFFGRAANVSAGDRQRLTLTGPGGLRLTDTSEPGERARAQVMRYLGRRTPPGGWPAGTYSGIYEILRGDRVVARREVSLALGE